MPRRNLRRLTELEAPVQPYRGNCRGMSDVRATAVVTLATLGFDRATAMQTLQLLQLWASIS